jgi:glycosyltransferase involved in cell wall biosynthesis
VISERNDPKHDGRGAFMQWYCNRIYHQAKAIVYQNEHEKSCFSKSLEKKGCIIPNPVSVAAVKTESSDVIATAGRLIEQKNQKILVSAMAQVHKVYPDVKCRIYGEGALREALQTQIDELGLQDIVTLEGNVKDIHARLSQCGIFALTSNFEGLSNALIEAMQVGLACITTDYPGARELITDGENGLVVPMNEADALAKSIIKLIENKDGCADTLAQQGQTFAARFNAETVLTQWHTAIEK